MSTITQPALPFFDFSDDSRLRFMEMLNEKPLSDRARRFVRLAYEGATEHGKAGLRVRYFREMLWVNCPQERLGELLECTDRTVRDMIRKELEPLGFLKVVKATPDQLEGPPREVTVYCISIARLAALPCLDPTDEVDAAILATGGDPFGELDPNHDQAVPQVSGPSSESISAPVSGGISGGSSGGISGGSSGGISGGISALMNHDHDHERVIEESSFIQVMNHDHDARGTSTPAAEPAKFHQMTDRHIRAIAGFAVEHEGELKTLNAAKRLDKLLEYFRDAVRAGQAEESELRMFAAVFRHVGRRPDIMHKAKYLRTMWTNRSNPDKPLSSVLTADDRSYARQLVEILQPAS